MSVNNLLHQIENEFTDLQRNYSKTVEKNNNLFKILATVKNDLEKTLKKPELLKETVYQCVDLLRANTPYYSTNDGTTKVDPPLTPEQKTL